MLCQNCGRNEANIRYTQIINGVKKEVAICSECAAKLGLEGMNFPLNFNSFLGDFFNDFTNSEIFPRLDRSSIKCKKCGMTLDEFINTGKFGCEECYDAFKEPLDSFLKNIHGTSQHIGRGPNGITPKLEVSDALYNSDSKVDSKKTEDKKEEKDSKTEIEKELKKAIAEERYEDAAKLRDKLKEMK